MPVLEHKKRLSGLRQAIKDASLDSFLVTNATNVSYLSGFRGTDAVMLVTADAGYFLTDSRYIEEAEKEIAGHLDVRLVEESIFASIDAIVRSKKLKDLGFESMDLPYGVAQKLKGLLSKTGFVPVKNLAEILRSVKDHGEIGRIRKAVRLAEEVFERAAGSVRPGVSEELIKREIELDLISKGSTCAFEPIVASGLNSSKPHARATNRSFKNNDFIMIDMGAKVDGYNSDLTRTVVLGRMQERFRKIYKTVGQAQLKAIDRITPGAKASDIDKAGRDHIKKSGFAKYFGHSLGHGVGMDVHEEPSISPSSKTRLVEGMIFTVEPAIYIPGFGGVRIEDMVLVTKRGCEILTR
ncbi:MAG: Xaa-Pro peptidase family protein [Candidatus Omnitrophica bacterium]|nr:Xaa-Pro peptidase family protein [Candidatus Omnitrophota bacterium]